ncbi:MAG: HEAT repeat domain-containing protein [Deltaproteobacteria bacterium]|nr:HEAT repeat domain-containing protein [Deltaproteobacteria bacterium]
MADFHKLIELGDVVTPANILRQMTRQHDETSDASRRTIFGQALAKLRGDAGTADRLVSLLQGSNERDSEAAGKLLAMFDAEAVLVKVLHVIRDHEDMRIRKRLLSFVGRFGETARDQILAELSPVSPWYYNRNLLNLLADIADDSMVPRITAHLEAKDERERRAAFAALARISGDGAQEALAESFDRQPESIRKSFIQHFGKTRARSAVPKLLDHLKSLAITDQTESYAVSIIHALGQIGDAAGAAAIRELLHKGSGLRRFFAKPSDAVIEASIVALGQIGDAAAAGSIKGFTRHANPQIARAAQESMRALGRTA